MEKISKKEDRRSIEFFISLREQTLRDIGIPDEFSLKNFLWALDYIKKIDSILSERNKKKSNSLMTDLFRKSINTEEQTPEKLIFPQTPSLQYLKQIKTKNLGEIQARAKKELGNGFDYLKMLLESEQTLSAKKILEKYSFSTYIELLQSSKTINIDDYMIIFDDIQESIDYRNRRIKELITYRYATTKSTEEDPEVFIKEAKILVSDKQNSQQDNHYRAESVTISTDKDAAPPPPSSLVQPALSWLNIKIKEQKETHTEEDEVVLEALKYFIIFEFIHPFGDNNGRTGRALFVFLQKYLSKNSPLKYTHIPIARNETGSVSEKHTNTKIKKNNRLGSQSYDIDMFILKIINNERMKEITKPLNDKNIDEKNLIKILNNIKDFLDKEMVKEIRELINVLKIQNKEDYTHKKDWDIVTNSIKKFL